MSYKSGLIFQIFIWSLFFIPLSAIAQETINVNGTSLTITLRANGADRLLDLVSQLAVAMIGAIIGFFFIFRWDMQKYEDDIYDRRITSLITLTQETISNVNDLISESYEYDQTRRIFVGEAHVLSLHSFLAIRNSGDYRLLSADLQMRFNNVSIHAQLFNDQESQLLRWSGSLNNRPTLANDIGLAILNKENAKRDVHDSMNELLRELRNESNRF